MLNYYVVRNICKRIYELVVSDCFVCSEDIGYKNKQNQKIINMKDNTFNLDVKAFVQSLGSWNDSENIGRYVYLLFSYLKNYSIFN